MEKINGIAKYYIGQRRLPAGAVPLASDGHAAIVCLGAAGSWVRWWPADGVIQTMPPKTIRAVMEVVINELGGTAKATAEKIDVSPRTVEAWRGGSAKMSIAAAYRIAEELAKD